MSEHEYLLTQSGELYHANFKYIKREKVNGKWVYTYPEDETGKQKTSFVDKVKNLFTKKSAVGDETTGNSAKAKDTTEKGKNAVINLFNNKHAKTTTDGANNIVKKGLDAINKKLPEIVNDIEDFTKNNKYIVTRSNRDEKIAEIEKSKEWQDIVKRGDPEYVKKDAEGNTTYLIDDYIVKKKHPELDLLDDIANGRNLTLNEVNAETLTAAAADYIRAGATVLGIVSKVLMTKFKFSQGAYVEQEEKVTRLITDGANYVSDTVSTMQTTVKDLDREQMVGAMRTVAEKTGNADLTRVVDDIDIVTKTVQTAASQIDTKEVNTAIQNISKVSKTASDTADTVQSVVNDVNSGDIYAKVLASALQSLSEEELRRLLQSTV